MKIGLVQFSPIWEDKKESIEKVNSLLEKINLSEIELLIFPELSFTGFSMNVEQLAEEIDGESMRYFLKLSADNKINVFGGLIEKYEDKFYNTLIHFDENGLIKARYRKIHPFSMTNEDKHFSAGKEIVVTKIGHIRFGLSICYDLRFPELYRLLTLKGAEVLVNIANWPVPRIAHWELLTQATAVQQLAYFIGVNRTGDDPYNSYSGSTCIVSPAGEDLVRNFNDEKIIVYDIDVEEVNKIRKKFPFLEDVKLISAKD